MTFPVRAGVPPSPAVFGITIASSTPWVRGVFGLSAQPSEEQREARDRLHLPFQLLSDSALQLKTALRLPTFSVAGMTLFKRLTLIAEDGKIRKVFYPVFPPDRHVDDVLTWLRSDVPPGAARKGQRR
jgi:peroxiredoxin